MSPHAPLLKQIPESLQDLSFWLDKKGQDSIMNYNSYTCTEDITATNFGLLGSFQDVWEEDAWKNIRKGIAVQGRKMDWVRLRTKWLREYWTKELRLFHANFLFYSSSPWKMEAICSSETSSELRWTTLLCIPDV
jgi:hypothetical protein